jgi:hypothetical protein
MKKQVLLTLSALAAALALATPAFACDSHHPMMAAQASQAASAAPSTRQIVQKMQSSVKKMPSQLARIAKAKTDEARQQALEAYMLTLLENMELAHSLQPEAMNCEGMAGMGEGMMKHPAMGQGGMGMMGSPAQPAPEVK